MWENYRYCDVHLIKPSGQHTKWRRIERERVKEWIEANKGALAYFSTIQSFSESRKTDGEAQWSPMFFDLDAPGWSNELSEEKKTALLESVLSDARKLIDYFAAGFEVAPRIWWSGGKGFHILVPGEAFAADPHPKLTYHWKHVAASIQKKLDLGSLDWRVYSNPRMWRIPNTIHHQAKHNEPQQYKIPLDPSDLAKGLGTIKKLAESPRALWLDDDDEEDQVEPNYSLSKLYKTAFVEFEVSTKIEDYDAVEVPVFDEDHPQCVAYLLQFGLANIGTKNRADMAFANYCKAKGMDLRDAVTFMSEWARSIPLSLTHVDAPEARIAQTTRVLNTVYADPKYHFSCGSMRSCGLKIDCKECGIEEESQTVVISLADFSKAENYGRRVCVEADVVGKDSSELITPVKVVGGCGFDAEAARCGRCRMGDYINAETNKIERTMTFDANEPRTLDLLDVTTTGVHNRIKRIFGVEDRCFAFKYQVEMGNANVIYLSSRISGEFNPEIEQMARTRAIFLGHEIELNKGYLLYGVVWNQPRTGKAVLLVDKLEPLQSTLSTFKLSEDRLQELAIFQQKPGQSPLESIKAIHSLFNADFIRVYGREELIMAVDLVFHSVRRLDFQKTHNLKGWLDILIIGDTRQGKSDVVEKIMAYYGLGVLAAGETAKRTGLLYTIRMIQGEEAWVAFGLLPRCNGYLVVIDEIHGMPPDDFKEFTLVRSKGIVDVKMTAYGTARAETRLISIANARPGKALATYQYPVQVIPDIPCFKALEDVARFDFCVGLRAGDVSDDMINTDVWSQPSVDNPYTPELCHDLVMWVWTRTPEQVHIAPRTERVILDLALEISQEYIPDIPLVESADIRHKIVRIAAAIAGRLYSTEDGVTLIIKPEHAHAAKDVLNEFYKAPGLNYWGWSDDHKRIMHSEDRLIELAIDFKVFFDLQWEDIATWILDVSEFNKSLLRSACGITATETDHAMAFFITNKFVVTDKYNYIKTPQGRIFLQSLFETRDFSDLEKALPAEDLETKEKESEF